MLICSYRRSLNRYKENEVGLEENNFSDEIKGVENDYNEEADQSLPDEPMPNNRNNEGIYSNQPGTLHGPGVQKYANLTAG